MASGLKTILVGVAPISLIYSAKHYQFGLSTPFDSIVTLGAALWCIVCFIIALDPNVAGKIAIMKDLKSAIPGLGKEDKSK
jgi:hypothetical protein